MQGPPEAPAGVCTVTVGSASCIADPATAASQSGFNSPQASQGSEAIGRRQGEIALAIPGFPAECAVCHTSLRDSHSLRLVSTHLRQCAAGGPASHVAAANVAVEGEQQRILAEGVTPGPASKRVM